MTERYGYVSYRVLMRRKGRLLGVRIPFSTFDVWGSEVHLGRWAEYDGETLREMFGAKWNAELDDIVGRGFLAVRGARARGGWVELSDGKGEISIRAATRRGRRGGSGLDTLIRHLHTEEHVQDYEDVVRLILSNGPAWALKEVRGWLPKGVTSVSGEQMKTLTVRARGANSSGKRAHDAHCPYCQTGLPQRLNDALVARKRR